MKEVPGVTIVFYNLTAVTVTYQISANVHKICEFYFTGFKNKSVEIDLHSKYLYFEMYQNRRCFDKQNLDVGFMGASVKKTFFK